MAKIQTKLRTSDFGPKRLLGQPDSVSSFRCGMLIGSATAITRGELPDGTEYRGLLGAFEYRDYDGTVAPKASGKLFLPEGINAMIIDAIEAMKADEKETGVRANVQFALDVGVQRAKNPAGYEWTFEPKGEIGVADPLASLRDNFPALEAPKTETKPEAKAKAA